MEKVFVLIIALVFTLLNSLHVITQWFSNTPDRLFTGIAHYFADYFLYVDTFAQGAAGHLTTTAHFTNEPVATTWIYWFNALLGWIGHLFGLSPFASYNLALFLLVFLLCLLWYRLVAGIYPDNRFARLTSFIFILTASNFFDKGQFWFSPAPAFNRLGGVPHQVFQTTVLVSLLIVFSRPQSTIFNSLFLILLSFLAAISNPIQTLLLSVAAGFTQKYFSFLYLFIPALVGSFLVNREFTLQPILTAAKIWENVQDVSVSLWQFFLAVGPLIFLVPFGIRSFLKKRDPLRMLFFSYGMLSLLSFFSPIPKLLGTASVRWLAPAPYAILGILGAEGGFLLSAWLSRLLTKILNFKYQISKSFCYLLFAIYYLLFTFPALYSQINTRSNPAYNTILTSDLNHVPKPIVDALLWLKNQPGHNRPVILTDPSLPYDVLVPPLTGKISFTGHPIHTLYPEVKKNLRQRFFNEEMTESEAKQFLTNHRIGWIVSTKKQLPLAHLAFSNDQLTIFAVE